MIKEENFKFCPNCGSNLKKQDEVHLSCKNCGLKYYLNPRPCNAVILKNNEGKFLFVKRKHDPHKGYWDLPGGFVNPKETMEESVIRELHEELKITIKDFKYLGSVHDTYDFGGIRADTLCFLFEGKISPEATIVPSDDAEEVAFFLPKEINLEKIGFKSLREFLKDYFKI